MQIKSFRTEINLHIRVTRKSWTPRFWVNKKKQETKIDRAQRLQLSEERNDGVSD